MLAAAHTMTYAAHTMTYSDDPPATRAFLADARPRPQITESVADS